MKDVILKKQSDAYKKYDPTSISSETEGHAGKGYGAETFSRVLADFINGKIKRDDLFYDSYAEKLASIKPTAFGISYHDDLNENGETVRNCKIVSTGNGSLKCKISVHPAEKAKYELQNFSGNRFFLLSPDAIGVITAEYRLSGSPEEIETIDVSF